MRTRDEVDVVPFVEHGHDVAAEEVSGTTGGYAPSDDLLRIAPHQVAHGAVVGDLLLPIDDAYLIERVDARAQSAMDREYAILDNRAQAQVIEYLRAVSPYVDAAVLTKALVVEAVYLRDLSTLVIAPYQRDAIGITYLERQ